MPENLKEKSSGLRGLIAAALLLAASQAGAQTIFYTTTSAAQISNTVEQVLANGAANTLVFNTAGGAPQVSRCTAAALDSWNGKIFFVDAGTSGLWSLNLDGSGLAIVKSNLTSFPLSLALDVLNEKIYYTTSSANQSANTIERMDYTGNNNTLLLTGSGPVANGGNGVQRCTALAIDTLHSKIFFTDAGSSSIWNTSLTGSSLSLVVSNLGAAPLDLALDVTNQLIYYVTSSTIQTLNTIQRIAYNGSNKTLLFTATGPLANGVIRCTALDLDFPDAKIYLADAGVNALWSVPIAGGSPASIKVNLPDSYVRNLRLLPPANVITVVNANDSGFGSLRLSISNLTSPGTINFNSAAFSGSPASIFLTGIGDTNFGPSALRVDKQVSIVGPANTTNGVTITRAGGAPAMRLFYVSPTGSLTLNNLTLSNGLAVGFPGGGGSQRGGSGGGSAGLGGGIFNQGILAIQNSTLVANQAIGGQGGGFTAGQGEGSGGGGGGLDGPGGIGGGGAKGGVGGPPNGGAPGDANSASVVGQPGGIGGGGGGGGSSTITNFSFGPGGNGGFGGGGGGGGAYNTVGFGGGQGGPGGGGGFGGGGGGGGAGTPDGIVGQGGFGGGHGGQGDGSGNIGSQGGGGAGMGGAVFNNQGTLLVANSTFSANAATGGAAPQFAPNINPLPGSGLGGAIFNHNGLVTILNATIAFNKADDGGGIFNYSDNVDHIGSIGLSNSIVANSILTNGFDYTTFATNSGSTTNFGANDLIRLNNGFLGGIVSTNDPRLTPLINNGGPTFTHALINGSPAIDAGANLFVTSATDQRGYPRIADGDGDGVSTVDLGAVEDGLVRIRTVPQTRPAIISGGFELFLTGESNRVYVTESSTNLSNWSPILTNLLPSFELQVFDTTPGVGNGPSRYYRLRTGP